MPSVKSRCAEKRNIRSVESAVRRRAPGRQVAIVVAHPDDETLGCGALLASLEGAVLIIVTDGAPRDLADARSHGFDTAKAYSAARMRELAAALEAGECQPASVISLGCPDQQAAHHLVSLSRSLATLFRSHGTRVALTHAYEGGHPDHDATAFAVQAGAELAAVDGEFVRVVEMPFYHLGRAGVLRQRFTGGRSRIVRLNLDRQEQERKRRMIAAYESQRSTLEAFELRTELFRDAVRHDFTELPNRGRLLYEACDWGLSGAEWLQFVRPALDELRREIAP